jgi:hypothetical protein
MVQVHNQRFPLNLRLSMPKIRRGAIASLGQRHPKKTMKVSTLSGVDGTAFQKIGFVKGNGTTNQPQQYTYTDALVSAVTYYRLKQVDTDGKFEYSKVVSVESNGDGLRVYPTLVSDGVLTVQGGQSDDCIVTNLLGQPVWMGKTTQQLDVSMLPKGTYLLKVGSEVTQFVKQ